MNTLQKGIALLLRSGITGEKLPLPEDFSLEEALPVLKKHSVIPLAFQGAVNCGQDQNNPAMQKMLFVSYRNLMTHEKQMRALEKLLVTFETQSIPILPVKGYNIKKLYPKPELRPMGDADILIREEDYSQIRPIMENLGFTQIEDSTHVYTWKHDDLLVELHKCLVDQKDADYHAYYGSGWRLAVPGEGSLHYMRAEDEYIYLFVHLAKHYRDCGIGYRHMVDLYVYRRKVKDLDMSYVRGELEKLRLWDFYENIMDTLQVWFEDGKENPRTELITEFVFHSGNWGMMETSYLNKALKAGGKGESVKNAGIKTAWRILFPSYETMAYDQKLLRQWPILLPIYWVGRWIRILTVQRKTIWGKLRILKQVDDDSVNSHRDALLAVGLLQNRKE